MPRLARAVIPGIAHHVTQRGNRRLPVFFSDFDRRSYLSLVAQGCAKAQVRCLAWCLMENHVHLILVPSDVDGLRAALGEAHRRHTRAVNQRQEWTGYLFQGRFASYPMEPAHLMAAVRYVERNPVAAGLVGAAADWPWSSARSHIAGRRQSDDPLTDLTALSAAVPNWRAMLDLGLEAGGLAGEDLVLAEAIEQRLRTGRPLGTADWIAERESELGRSLLPARRGPKIKPANRSC